jgi:hypothetical protein
VTGEFFQIGEYFQMGVPELVVQVAPARRPLLQEQRSPKRAVKMGGKIKSEDSINQQGRKQLY